MKPRHVPFVLGIVACLLAPGTRAESRLPSAHDDARLHPATARSAPSANTPDWRDDIRRHAQRMIDAGFFPGMEIAVTRGDEVVYAGGFGVADVGTGRRIDNRTRFYIASTTKALTATAVILQASRGTLPLDAPVTRYLPELKFKAPLNAKNVTLRDLLDMTDGIDACFPVVFRTAFTGVFTQQELIRSMRHCGASSTGHAFSYRNLPYNMLGMVLAPGIKNGWKAIVRRDVLEPLGMRQTTARISTLAPARIAMPHRATGDGFRRIRLAKVDANLHAAGGEFTTACDLARFVAVHASDGMLDGKRIFPAGVLASTHARHAVQDRDFGPYHRFGWGYGWDLGTYSGHLIVHRFGRFMGYRSHASFMPDTGVGVVVLVNGVAAPYAVDAMADYIYERLGIDPRHADRRFTQTFKQLEDRKARFAAHLRKQQAIERARQRHPLPHALAAYTGQYTNPLLGTMLWRIRGGHLDVQIGAARSVTGIYDAAKNQFRIELTGQGEVVTFRFAKDPGPPDSLEYNGYRFERR